MIRRHGLKSFDHDNTTRTKERTALQSQLPPTSSMFRHAALGAEMLIVCKNSCSVGSNLDEHTCLEIEFTKCQLLPLTIRRLCRPSGRPISSIKKFDGASTEAVNVD